MARRVRRSLSRLELLLPLHPGGYRRFLDLMESVSSGGGPYLPWSRLKAGVVEDFHAARTLLERSHAVAPADPDGAVALIKKGAGILRRYPLHPETLHDWSREALRTTGSPSDALGDLASTEKVSRLLRRTIDVLERERDRLTMANLRLVLHEAFRYPASGMYTSDLFQEGFLGVQKAAFRFDPERGLRFSTYATHWIRMSLRKALTDRSSLIRVPQFAQEKLRREGSELTDQQHERIRRCLSQPASFSSFLADKETSFEPREPVAPQNTEALHTETVPEAVSKALLRLDKLEQDIVRWRFGIGGGKRESLQQIGSRVNLSRERVRQIAARAIEKMRHYGDLRETYEDLRLAAVSSVA